jgi:hypothetical protein
LRSVGIISVNGHDQGSRIPLNVPALTMDSTTTTPIRLVETDSSPALLNGRSLFTFRTEWLWLVGAVFVG